MPHGAALAGYHGAFALLREASCIVSVPASHVANAMEAPRACTPTDVYARDALAHAFAPHVEQIISPAWLGYTDTAVFRPADLTGTRRLTRYDRAALRTFEMACDPTDLRPDGMGTQ